MRGDVTAKMADSLGVGVSEEKDPENERHETVKCSWAVVSGSGKAHIGLPQVKMPETLGFYGKPALKDEPRERAGEFEHLTDLRFYFLTCS